MAVVSNNCHSVNSGEVVIPEKATILGRPKVISQEYNNIEIKNIDIKLENIGDELLNEYALRILDEAYTASSGYMVAYRGRQRLCQMYERVTY